MRKKNPFNNFFFFLFFLSRFVLKRKMSIYFLFNHLTCDKNAYRAKFCNLNWLKSIEFQTAKLLYGVAGSHLKKKNPAGLGLVTKIMDSF